jgi:hypothetical protein
MEAKYNKGLTVEILTGGKTVTSMTVEIKNSDLFGGFAQAFNKLCSDADVPMKNKIALTKLRRLMMEQAKSLADARDLLKDKEASGETITEEDIKAFEELMQESNHFPFNRIDATLIAKNLNVIELDTLSPIIKS